MTTAPFDPSSYYVVRNMASGLVLSVDVSGGPNNNYLRESGNPTRLADLWNELWAFVPGTLPGNVAFFKLTNMANIKSNNWAGQYYFSNSNMVQMYSSPSPWSVISSAGKPGGCAGFYWIGSTLQNGQINRYLDLSNGGMSSPYCVLSSGPPTLCSMFWSMEKSAIKVPPL